MRSRAVRIAVGLVVGMLLAGCSDTTGTPAPSTPVPSERPGPATVWERTVDRVGADGQLDKATALAAFTLAVAPLPGVTRPAGATGDIMSGTMAVSAVLRHWQALTVEQQRAVLATLDTRLVTGNGARTAGKPILACPTKDSADAAPYRAMAEEARDRIAAKLGPLNIDLVVTVDPDDSMPGFLYTWGCAGTKNQDQTRERLTGCTIHAKPASSLKGNPEADVRGAIYHEVMHCFLYGRFQHSYLQMPKWYIEGAPNWVMSVLGPSNKFTSASWARYLEKPHQPLAKRAYTGMGFFAHLAETGTDPWPILYAIGQASLQGTEAGWQAANPSSDFLTSYGSGFVQGRYPGQPWLAGGPNLFTYPGPLETKQISDGKSATVQSVSTAAAAAIAHVDAEVVQVTPGPGAFGRVSLGGGADATLDLAAKSTYCTLGAAACKCPKDSPRADTKFTPMTRGNQYLGLTGGLKPATASVSGMKLEDFCAVGPLVGRWVTTAVAAHAQRLGFTWDFSGGGAGIQMSIDGKNNLTASYGTMTAGNYAMTGPDGKGQRGRMICRGVERGKIQPAAAKATSGKWAYRPVHYGLTGVGQLTEPLEMTVTFPPNQGGCSMGAFPRGVFQNGTWKLTGKKNLTITFAGTRPADGIPGQWAAQWHLVRTG